MALKLQKVLISDSVDPSCRQILEQSGIQVDYKTNFTKEELIAAVKVCTAYDIKAAFVRNGRLRLINYLLLLFGVLLYRLDLSTKCVRAYIWMGMRCSRALHATRG